VLLRGIFRQNSRREKHLRMRLANSAMDAAVIFPAAGLPRVFAPKRCTSDAICTIMVRTDCRAQQKAYEKQGLMECPILAHFMQ
jgi:hypothetical protein